MGSQKPGYFQGQVEYSLEYIPRDAHVQPEQIAELVGSRMIMIMGSKGNYKQQFFAPDGTLRSARYVDLREKKAYMKMADVDTLFWFDITVEDTKSRFTVLGDTLIDQHPCVVIDGQNLIIERNGQQITLEDQYIFATDLPINPEWYREFKEANYYRLMSLARGILLESTIEVGYWKRRLKARSIEWRKVKKREFTFPEWKDLPHKQM